VEWVVLGLILGLQVVILWRQAKLEKGGAAQTEAAAPARAAEAPEVSEVPEAPDGDDGFAGAFAVPARVPGWRRWNPWEDFERAWGGEMENMMARGEAMMREMGRMFDGADAAGWGGARQRPRMGMRDAGDRYEIWVGPVEGGDAEVEVQGREVAVRWHKSEEGAGRRYREERASRFRLPGPAAEGDGAVRTVRDGERLKIEILKPGAAESGELENRGDEGAEA
jgi:hypothetical protein